MKVDSSEPDQQETPTFRTVFHYCSITQELIQEHIETGNYTYICGACSEALLLSDGKVINMAWEQIGEWVEGKGEYRQISTGKVLRFVGKNPAMKEKVKMSERNLVYEYEGVVNKLKKQIRKLEAQLLAHIENEGDECPLCQLEAQVAGLAQYIRTLEKSMKIGELLTWLGDETKDGGKAYAALPQESKDAISLAWRVKNEE